MSNRITLQPAFVLHTRPYRDTSLLVDLLSLHHGLLTAIAKGVRKSNSHWRGLLLLFVPLLVSWSGKNELKTLNTVEPNGTNNKLSNHTTLSAFYLNELLMRVLQKHDPHPQIYQNYQLALNNLSNGLAEELVLRRFEKQLLANLGYGLQLATTIDGAPVDKEAIYNFEFGVGLTKTLQHPNYATHQLTTNEFAGASLLALDSGTLTTTHEFQDAKRLMRQALAPLLGTKPLKTRELFINKRPT